MALSRIDHIRSGEGDFVGHPRGEPLFLLALFMLILGNGCRYR
jgi:hypothetical protein